MEKLKLLLVTNKYNLNFRYTWRKVDEQVCGMPQQVLPTGHDLVVELLGEKVIANLMESWCFDLKTISSILFNDVKESVGSSTQHGQQLSPPHDDFQVDIDPTMGQDLRCILDIFLEHTHYICKKYELGVERIIEHNEAMGARIIKEFQKSFMEMKSFGEKLQQELCKKVDIFMEFTVQLKQRNIPRLVYFVQKNNQMPTFGTLVTSFIPGLKCAQLHLMCEHIDGIHDVKNQEGFEVMLANETFQKVRPLLDKGLQILSILLKVGAQLTIGLASQVPDLKIGSIFGGASLIIPAQLPMTISSSITSEKQMAKEVADKWLVDTMKQVPDIVRSFDLHKVIYWTGQCKGQMAWVCGEHKELGLNNKSLREI
jgi:hypothetical protein